MEGSVKRMNCWQGGARALAHLLQHPVVFLLLLMVLGVNPGCGFFVENSDFPFLYIINGATLTSASPAQHPW
jgi:hypothetical protein